MSRGMDNPAYLGNADQVLDRPGYIPAWRWRWQWSTFARPIVVGVFAALIAAATAFAGKFLVIDNATPSDLIVVLGGDDGSRFPRAVQLLKSGYAKEAIVDADARGRWLGRTEADRRAAEIALVGDVGSRMHVCPMVATSTAGETRDFSACVHAKAGTRILIVTSDFHSRRALLTFRNALPQYQWSVASTTDEDLFGTSWWRHSKWATTTAAEWEKLLWWEVVERWGV